MRKLLGLLLCIGLCTMLGLGSVGCSKKKEKEAEKKKADGGAGPKDKEEIILAVEAVTIETTDKKGKGQAKITATRKKYAGPIELTFTKVEGVEIKDATIKKDEDSATVDVMVSDKAKAGEHKVTVKGTGGKASHDTELKLTIKEKDSAPPPKKAKITLTPPEDPVAIKLDKDKKGKGTATISAKREGDVGAIDLKFGKAPKGVTFKAASIAKGKDSVDVEVTVDGAEPGDAEIVVTGTGGEATAETKLKLKITK